MFFTNRMPCLPSWNVPLEPWTDPIMLRGPSVSAALLHHINITLTEADRTAEPGENQQRTEVFYKVWGSWRTISPVADTQIDGSRSTTYSSSPASNVISVLICASLGFSVHNVKSLSGQKYLKMHFRSDSGAKTTDSKSGYVGMENSLRADPGSGSSCFVQCENLSGFHQPHALSVYMGVKRRRQRSNMKIKHKCR